MSISVQDHDSKSVKTIATDTISGLEYPMTEALPRAHTASSGACSVSNQASLATPNIKASAGNVYGISVVNKDAALLYIQFYNTAGTPTRGTSVVWWIPVAASATVNIPPGAMALANHSAGIGVTAATTATGSGAPSTAPDVVIYYK